MNLIYCTSPLQALIAERIIDLYPNEQFYCVFDGNPKQAKNPYYYKRLKAKCQGGVFIPRETFNNVNGAYRFLLGLVGLVGLRVFRVKRVFIASLNSYIFRLLMASMQNAELYTYDDGSLNLSPEAFKMMNTFTDNKAIRLMKRFLDIPEIKDLEARSLRHYTIYHYPNVMPRCEYISLQAEGKGLTIDAQSIQINQTQVAEATHARAVTQQESRVMSIFLGQRVCSFDTPDEDIALTERIITTYGIGYYLPHPKETYTIKGVEYIQTPLIAEDYILQILEENPDLEVRLYSYCSTALLNLSATPRVRVRAIKPKKYLPLLEETFDNYSRLGIPMDCLD